MKVSKPKQSAKVAEVAAPSDNQWVYWALTCFAGISFIVMFGMYAWGFNKGLDLNIEGFYLLSLQRPESYPFFSSFHIILSKVPRLVESEVLHYRILEGIARFVPTALLAVSFKKWLNPEIALSKLQTVYIVFFTLIGAILTFCSFPRTISYNGLASGCSVAASACMFYALARLGSGTGVATKDKYADACMLAAGFLTAFAGFAKFTTGLCLLPAIVLALWLQKRPGLISWTLAGTGLGFGCFFLFFQNPIDWWNAFSNFVAAESISNHSAGQILESAGAFLSKDAVYIIPALLAMAGLNIYLNKAKTANLKQSRRAFRIAIFLACGLMAIASYNKAFIEREAYLGIAALILVGACLLTFTKEQLGSRSFSGTLFVAALPLFASFGTNTSLIGHVASTLGPWFMLIAIGSIVCLRKFIAPYAVAVLTIAICSFSVYQFYYQYVCEPYDIIGPLAERNVPVPEIPQMKGITVTAHQAQYFTQIKQTLVANGFQPGDPLICLYDCPGAVWMVDGVSPGQAWYVGWEERDVVNARYLLSVDKKTLHRVFFFLPSPIRPQAADALRKLGIGPEKFQKIGVVSTDHGRYAFLCKVDKDNSN